ncbi:MAG TPA: glutamine--tRNA ligase/YqeY domain fusion protein [Phycisphaerales bacterium]|nr:glutamine--tRNA ligase/YqeY domain fusion protein [Phycisphaerales bacterium]
MSDAGKPVTTPVHGHASTGAHTKTPSQPETDARREPAERPPNFIEQIIDADGAALKWGAWPGTDRPKVHTRFPPEPNGYLHVGHAKSICLNFGLAQKYGGKFNLRFDDTNPAKEEQEYVDGIIRDVLWLGADFTGPHGGGLFYASDLFGHMYEYAEDLVRKGLAYVCGLSAEEVSKRRGTPSVPATSPFRDRPVDESLRLLREMKEGKHPNGAMTLRAKIDLTSPNFNLRDPVMYRILHEEHQHTGGAWCIYPMYDWAHGIEDSAEGITHSICTLEFENHRPLYDWFIDAINAGRDKPAHHAQQIEFAKLIFNYTVLSKRNLLRMVQEKRVNGWDDPRMPTICGLRRRGYPAAAIRALCEEVGVTKTESVIDLTRLENSVRDHLNKHAPRAMCVLRPLRVVIENWPKNADGSPVVEHLDFVVNPEAAERAKESGAADVAAHTRRIPFSGELFIERDDFMENPPKKFFRLSPGTEVRLRWAYFIKCVGVEKDADGNATCVRCTYDPATRGGDAPPGPNGEPPRKVKATLHWVSAAHAVDGEVRLFDRLFRAESPGGVNPDGTKRDFVEDLNPASLEVITDAKLDPHLLGAARYRTATRSIRVHERGREVTHDIPIGEGDTFQFERLGYFCVDPDSGKRFGGSGAADKLVFNRAVTLKDTWAKESGKQ